MRTKQINRYHMRMPLVITGPQDRAFDVQNFYKNIANGEPFVLAYDNFSDIQTSATMPERAREYIGDKLQAECRTRGTRFTASWASTPCPSRKSA